MVQNNDIATVIAIEAMPIETYDPFDFVSRPPNFSRRSTALDARQEAPEVAAVSAPAQLRRGPPAKRAYAATGASVHAVGPAAAKRARADAAASYAAVVAGRPGVRGGLVLKPIG